MLLENTDNSGWNKKIKINKINSLTDLKVYVIYQKHKLK